MKWRRRTPGTEATENRAVKLKQKMAPVHSSKKTMRFLLACLLCLIANASFAQSAFPVPDGYELQHLDPTDGRIAKPHGWYYTSNGTKSGWLWTISKEEPTKGYETGMRIQLLVGVEKNTHRSREDFAQNFLQKKRSSTTVVKDCAASDQGDFTRQCIEVIENIPRQGEEHPYHILYSVLWGKRMDMVVVTTFGAPADRWDDVKNTVDAMAPIEIIGPNFGKNAQ